MQNELEVLACKYGTDKRYKKHGYTKYYNEMFSGIRSKPLKVLEIGVKRGASLRMWKEYFQKSIIYGIDIDPKCNFDEDKICIFIGSQNDTKFLQKVGVDIGSDIDIVIDDGSHQSEHQITSFNALFPYVKAGGLYVIEDLHTSYDPNYNINASISSIDFLKKMINDLYLVGRKKRGNNKRKAIDGLNGTDLSYTERFVEGMTFYPGLCIIRKMS